MNAKRREWLCRHPVFAVTAGSLFWLLVAAVISELGQYLIERTTIPDINNSVIAPAILALIVLGMAMTYFIVIKALALSGMSLKKVLPGLIFTPLEIVIFFLAMITMESIREGRMANFGTPAEIVIQLTTASVVLAIVQLLCLGAAAYWARRQIRLGKWAAPGEADKTLVETPSLRELMAASPVWTMNLLAVGTAAIAVVAALVMQEAAEKNEWLAGKLAISLLVGLCALVLLAAIFAATVGVLLARRGQSTQRVLVSAFWFPVTFGLPVALFCACEYGMFIHRGYDVKAVSMMWLGIFGGYFGAIYYIAGQFVGWLVAAIYGWFWRRKKKAEAIPVPAVAHPFE